MPDKGWYPASSAPSPEASEPAYYRVNRLERETIDANMNSMFLAIDQLINCLCDMEHDGVIDVHGVLHWTNKANVGIITVRSMAAAAKKGGQRVSLPQDDL